MRFIFSFVIIKLMRNCRKNLRFFKLDKRFLDSNPEKKVLIKKYLRWECMDQNYLIFKSFTYKKLREKVAN